MPWPGIENITSEGHCRRLHLVTQNKGQQTSWEMPTSGNSGRKLCHPPHHSLAKQPDHGVQTLPHKARQTTQTTQTAIYFLQDKAELGQQAKGPVAHPLSGGHGQRLQGTGKHLTQEPEPFYALTVLLSNLQTLGPSTSSSPTALHCGTHTAQTTCPCQVLAAMFQPARV